MHIPDRLSENQNQKSKNPTTTLCMQTLVTGNECGTQRDITALAEIKACMHMHLLHLHLLLPPFPLANDNASKTASQDMKIVPKRAEQGYIQGGPKVGLHLY